jgi:hypothetical protein
MVILLILHIILAILSMDPKMPISVNNITWYYGTYAEVINNNTSIYNGVGINATVSISITNNLQIPINATYTLNVGGSTETITETLQPGVNIVNMTAPALGQGVYNAVPNHISCRLLIDVLLHGILPNTGDCDKHDNHQAL